VASVNSSGTVTAVAAGLAQVAATSAGKSGTSTVTVTSPGGGTPSEVATVTTTPTSVPLTALGETAQITATARDSSGSIVLGATFNWESLNPSVATVNAFGQVTPQTVGIALILVAATCCGTSDPVSNSNNPPPAGTPWFEENWDYSNTSDMLGQSHLVVSDYGVTPALATGLTTPWGGSTAFELAMNPTNYGGGFDVIFPKGGQDQPREIWQETYIKFSSNWKTDFGGSGNPDHKTILWLDRNSEVRWSFHIGVYGGSIKVFNVSSNPDPPVTYPNLATSIWDGTWHHYRIHFNMGTPGGGDAEIQLWIDGVLSASANNLPAPNTADHWFYKACLGRNLNQQPDQNQTVWYGRTRVWTSDPGWN